MEMIRGARWSLIGFIAEDVGVMFPSIIVREPRHKKWRYMSNGHRNPAEQRQMAENSNETHNNYGDG